MNDEINDLIYLPSGELNFPYVLANANLLLKGDEVDLAISLFDLITQHKTHAHCGFYGLAQCYQKRNQFKFAIPAFEKAFQMGKRPYMAFAWIEALIANKKYKTAENTALKCATQFASDIETGQRLRGLHRKAVELQFQANGVYSNC